MSTRHCPEACPCGCAAHQLVRPHDEIADLVKESEVRTGIAGRRFVIAGADRLAYRVLAHPGGLEVARLDGDGQPVDVAFVSEASFEQHLLAHAQRAGWLFTQPVWR